MMTADEDFTKDISDINRIEIVPTLLNVICQTTGMRFAAIARVTEDRWVTCSVHDEILFGLKPGDELKIETTLCNEVRQLNKTIVIDHVAEDEDYRDHHTPAMYGFQSYISVPIIRRDGSLFGTLCAIDPKPNTLKTPAVTGMFELYAELISFHLNAIDQVQQQTKTIESQKEFSDLLEQEVAQRTEAFKQQNLTLQKLNAELESFAFISSHQMQEPLRKIQTFSNLITEQQDNLTDTGKIYFKKIENMATLMRTLINDLLSYSKIKVDTINLEVTPLTTIIEAVKTDLDKEIKTGGISIELKQTANVKVMPVQFRLLIYNIIHNAVKFAAHDRALQIEISCTITSNTTVNNVLKDGRNYVHIRIADNGIGFDQKYNEQIFEIFQKLNTKEAYDGNGIGLTLAKRIAENHEGDITAEGKPGEGAVFNIYIPA